MSTAGSHPQEGCTLTVHVHTVAAGSGEQLQSVMLSGGQAQVSGSAGHCDMEMVNVVNTGMKNWVPVMDGSAFKSEETIRASSTGSPSGSKASRTRSCGEYRLLDPSGRLLLTYSRIAINARVRTRTETSP
jgi:hypothetical protein